MAGNSLKKHRKAANSAWKTQWVEILTSITVSKTISSILLQISILSIRSFDTEIKYVAIFT